MCLNDNKLLRRFIGEGDVDALIVASVGGCCLKGVVLVKTKKVDGKPRREGSLAGDFSPSGEFIG